jgi:hypothetical protein
MAVEIDWSQASVDGGSLPVPFAGKTPKKWTDRLEDVAGSLTRGGHGWGEVSVGRKKLRVDDVTPGCEADLRHFVESAVLQANADVSVEDEDDSDEERSDADQQMTESFRSFAE